MSTYKFFLCVFLFGMIIFVGYIEYKISNFNALPTEYDPYIISTCHSQDDTLRIAYIGDSWASMHGDHYCQIPKIISDSIHAPVETYSFGIGGRTSKEIYEDIFNNSEFRHFFETRKYKYCIISIGINDLCKKKRITYYQKSMYYIIKFCIVNNLHPIILEIPDFDIDYSYETLDFSRKVFYYYSMIHYNTPFDSKQLFRDALDEMMIQNGFENKVNIIRYKSWNKNGYKDWKLLYSEDRMHLNEKGYAKLDSCIAKTCIKLEE